MFSFSFFSLLRTPIEQLRNEMQQLDTRIAKLSSQLQSTSCPTEVRSQMADFLLVAARDLNSLKDGLEDAARANSELAEYFCEDPSTFKLGDCFKIVLSFCNR